MGKLRHVAIAVEDIGKSATFYEQAFGMQRVRETSVAVLLSDGVVSLAIIDNKKSNEAAGHHGVHHFGFIVDDLDRTCERVEQVGGIYADDPQLIAARLQKRGDVENGRVKAAAAQQEQRKYRDPDGIDFDIVNDEHARNAWRLPV